MGAKCCSGPAKDSETKTEAIDGDPLADVVDDGTTQEEGAEEITDHDAAAAAIAAMAAAAVSGAVQASSSGGGGLGSTAKAGSADGGEDLDALLQKEEEMRAKEPLPTPSGPPAASSASGAGDLQPGDLVEIAGLKSAQHLNGQKGRVVGLNKDSGRWEVTLTSGEIKALRMDNLIVKERFADVKQQDDLKVGDVILVVNLKMATALNGQLGGIMCKATGDTGRWEVLFADKTTKALRPENLLFQSRGIIPVPGAKAQSKKPLTPEQARKQKEAEGKKKEKVEADYKNLAGAANDMGCGQQ